MHIKIKFTLGFIILFLNTHSFAQKSIIYGRVLDQSGNPIEFSSLSLFKIPDTIRVSSQTSGDSGVYVFSDLHEGQYLLAAYNIGYKKEFSDIIKLDGIKAQQIDIILTSDVLQTDQVIITNEKPLVTQEADRMVVNIESTMGNSGLNAMDLLRKSPGVSVDKDGKISIKGKKGVLVMVDDKPLYMGDSQIESLLKSIPSDQVKEIELITNPTAKYDASGNSGIVNIKLKKSLYEGFDGSINLSYGTGVYHKSSQGLNLGYKKKSLTLNLGYQYNNRIDLEKASLEREYLNSTSAYSQFESNSYLRLPTQSHSLIFGSQYKIARGQTLGFDINGSFSKDSRDGDGSSSLYKKGGQLNNNYISTDQGSGSMRNVNTNLEYKIALDTNGTLLSLNGNYNKYFGSESKLINIQYFDSLNRNTNNPYLFSYQNRPSSDQYSVKADFVKSVLKKVKLESGIKLNSMVNNSPADIMITQDHLEVDASNHFLYNEKIYAAYIMLSQKRKKLKYNVGLRMEHTDVIGTLSRNDSSFTRNYTNFFPSGNITYNISSKTSMSIAYSRRIQRPTAEQLNPILSIVDPYTGWGGNPYLLPQIANNFTFNYSIFSGVIVASLSYSRNTNHISYIVLTDENSLVARGSFMNMKYRDNIGLSLNVNHKVLKWWTSTNFINVFQTLFVGGVENQNMTYSQASWTFTSTQTFQFPRSIGLELSGTYEAPKAQNAFGYNMERWQINAAIRKNFMKDRLTLKIAITDMFWTYNFRSVNTMNDTKLTNIYNWDNRVLMGTLSYKFGKRSEEGKK